MPPSAVPTGVAPEGDYTGPLRPQVHFSPPVGCASALLFVWGNELTALENACAVMNDPNGLFRASNGTWHLYYQCELPFYSSLPSSSMGAR